MAKAAAPQKPSPPAPDRVKTSLTLDAEMLVRLKSFAAQQRRRVNELVEQAIREYLQRNTR